MALGEDETRKLALCTNCGEAARCTRDNGVWRPIDGECDNCGGRAFRRFEAE